ncbi:MAG: RsmB/NOP family class I SAM-dependent RNA methyltransferase [Opitutaceae bacterium]
MNRIGSQRRVFRELLGRLRPHWRLDPALPARIERLLGGDRRLGSRDRRLYRELIYTTLRHLPWIEPLLESMAPAAPGPGDEPALPERVIAWLAADTPATHAFRAELAGDFPPAAPASVAGRAAILASLAGLSRLPSLLPDWIESECPGILDSPDYDALNSRAPLWLRLQSGNRAEVLGEFARLGWDAAESALLPGAVAIRGEADVLSTEACKAGRVEVQDLGSQLILEAVGVAPGGAWLDACAGAGGKSLQLAALLGPGGRVEAHDIRPAALGELARRARRAGFSGRIRTTASPKGPYDGVLVDAPCSGSGTWRRSPHLKWVTRPAGVRAFARRQLALLDRFAPLVRTGGLLVYATCSLCRSENEEVVRIFLSGHPGFEPAGWAREFTGERRESALLFRPAAHDGDGFFAACLRRSGRGSP